MNIQILAKGRGTLARYHGLLMPMTLAAITMLVLAAAMLLNHTQEQAAERVATATQNLAKSVELSFDSKIDTIDIALLASADEITRQIASREISVPNVSAYLQRQMRRLPNVILRATDASGNVVYEPGATTTVANILDREYFVYLRDHPKAGLFISEPIFGKINNRWIWLFARRIDDAKGQFAGVVFARIDVEVLEKMLAEVKLERGSTIALRSADYSFIAGYQSGAAVYPVKTGDKARSPAFQAALQANPQQGTYVTSQAKVDAQLRRFSYTRSKKYGFLTLASVTGTVAYADWYEQVGATVGFVALFSLAMMAFAWFAGRAWRVQEQHLVELQEARDQLEQRVSARTMELEEALGKLQRSQEELTRSEGKATLNVLVASVSHELNTPIGNSLIAAGTLKDQAAEFKRQVEAGALKRTVFDRFLLSLGDATKLIERNLLRAEELLSNFRHVAADQASEQRRRFDVHTVLQEVLDTMAPSLKRTPHHIDFSVPAGIFMDSLPGPLGQAAINLINNAYLHAFEGRENGVLTISGQVEDGTLCLRFADNGNGMSAAHLDKLFQPFFSTKIGKGGTGLGMAIVQDMVVKSLGGTITVTSTLGLGTTYILRLPLVLA